MRIWGQKKLQALAEQIPDHYAPLKTLTAECRIALSGLLGLGANMCLLHRTVGKQQAVTDSVSLLKSPLQESSDRSELVHLDTSKLLSSKCIFIFPDQCRMYPT